MRALGFARKIIPALTVLPVLTALAILAAPVVSVAPAAFAGPSAVSGGTPVVVKGGDLPHLLGRPISSIRVFGSGGSAIPFQIDEVTEAGEYVLDRGEAPNVNDGNGVLDRQDEIVFLWGDADGNADIGTDIGTDINTDINTGGNTNINTNINTNANHVRITIGRRSRVVTIRSDSSPSAPPPSTRRYVEYNHATRRVTTPYYYAEFAGDRFHFLRAGVKRFDGAGGYLNLTNELRVEILLRALFGLVPIRYNENSMVCHVRRYKAGPVRLIRRGDFHLNLGMGIKGSRAAVNQICYPQIVEVPVRVSLPVNFRTLFSQAYIEMTPVIRETGDMDFRFIVDAERIDWSVNRAALGVDSLQLAMPAGKTYMVRSGATGYGWTLNTTMDPAHLGGSGFVMRRPPPNRSGVAECGFRLTVRDVPRGNYYITNLVLFSDGEPNGIKTLGESVRAPVKIEIVN